MRFLIVILNMLILFQPSSWAMGVSMPAHQGMAYMDAISQPAPSSPAQDITPAHCQSAALDNSLSQTGHQAPKDSDKMQADCMSSCLNACVTSVNLLPVTTLVMSRHYTEIAYHAPSVSFNSHTESPEIRPPLLRRS